MGDCVWNKKIYETQDDAIDGGLKNDQKGYPPVVFTAEVGKLMELLRPVNPFLRFL